MSRHIFLLFVLFGFMPVSVQAQTPNLLGWQKVWEFALTDDTLGAALVDTGGEDGLRLVTLHADRVKEDTLQIRIWRRDGEGWRSEWQSALDAGELRGMIAGAFVKGSRVPQVLTPRNLILPSGIGYEKRARAQEVNWFGYASLPDGTDIAISAFPGGLWKGVVSPDSRGEWLRFERVKTDDLLSLPQQFDDADWVVLVNPPRIADAGGEQWAQQGYERLFAQMGKRMHPDQPLVVSRREGESRQRIELVVPPALSSPMRMVWQSEAMEGTIREVRLVSAPKLRGGLLVLVGKGASCTVQFWRVQRSESTP